MQKLPFSSLSCIQISTLKMPESAQVSGQNQWNPAYYLKVLMLAKRNIVQLVWNNFLSYSSQKQVVNFTYACRKSISEKMWPILVFSYQHL